MVAVFKREFKSYFTNPLGFIIIAVFTACSGVAYYMVFRAGSPDVQGVINFVASTVTLLATPFISMRLISEDRRQKVDQVLFTAPVTVTGIVLGKFLAAMALYTVGLAALFVYPFITAFHISIDWVIYLYARLGILCLGAVMISIGMFISSLTESPVVSAASTFAVFLAVMLFGSYTAGSTSPVIEFITKAISFIDRFYSFISGVADLSDLVYMLSVAALFVFLTVRSVERRRWA